MPEPRDPKIREAIAGLALASRPAPRFDELVGIQVAPPLRRMPNWVVAVGVAVVLLILIGASSIVFGRLGDPLEPAPPVGVVTTTIDEARVRNAGGAGVWMDPHGGTLLSVTPAVLAPVEGVFEVAVRGFAIGESGGVGIMACPGAQGIVDAETWPGWNGDLSVTCELGDDANPTVVTSFEEGSFETTLQVQVNVASIEDGGIVIVAGNIWVPASGTILLRIADEPETPWETATDRLNVSQLTHVISYWPPFITTFNMTYDELRNCDQAYATAQAGQFGYLSVLEDGDDTNRDKPGIEYDRHVARLISAERWLQDHTCPGSYDFVRIG